MYTLPKLDFAFDALEPYFDEETLVLHYSKHHQGYADKLNMALAPHPDLAERPAEDLIRDLANLPEAIRLAVRNAGGGYVNHNFFWSILRPASIGENLPTGDLAKLLDGQFGDWVSFQKQFSDQALGFFGSGWVWLVLDQTGQPAIVTTANQDSPLSAGLTPLLALDLWEHAYYLKYQNRRAEFIKAAWSLFDWAKVSERWLVAK